MATSADSLDLDRAHGRTPQQSRSRRTMARIVEAADVLFAERGYDGTSVNDIVARAGCSIGTFYARFTDKESLFLHLHAHHCRMMIDNIDALGHDPGLAEADLPTLVRRIIDAQYRFADKRRSITRVFIQRSGQDAAFHAGYADAWGEVSERLRALLMTRRNEIGHPDPERAAAFVVQMLHASWANDVLHHGMQKITGAVSGARARAELAAACLAYLGAGNGDQAGARR